MSNYTYWQNCLKGEVGPIHADDPQPGFYRKKAHKRDGWERVAIWEHEGQMVATVDGKAVDANEIWTWCADRAITEEVYRAVESGGQWPDEVPGLGHNAPEASDEFEKLKDQIESARSLIDNYKEIETQDQADQAANLRDRLNKYAKQADKIRTEKKQPHLDAGREIDGKWNPLKDAAKAAADLLRAPMTVFMRKEEKKREEAAEKARKEAEDKQRKQQEEVERARKRGAPEPIQEELQEPVEAAPLKIGGASGRRAGLRTQTSYEITDYEACLANVKDQPDVKAAVEKVAFRLAKAGAEVPGVKVIKQKVAA